MRWPWSVKRTLWIGLPVLLVAAYLWRSWLVPQLTVGRTQVMSGSVSFSTPSPDGKWVAVGLSGPSRLRLIQVQQQSSVEIGPYDNYSAAYLTRWSPDSRYLAYVNNGQVQLFDPQTGSSRLVSVPQLKGLFGLTWTPSGDGLAIVDKERVRIVSVNGGEPRELFPGGVEVVVANLRPDARSLGLRRGANGQELLAVSAPGSPVTVQETGVRKAFVSPDGWSGVVSRAQGKVELIDWREGRRIALDLGEPGTLHGAWSPDGRQVALIVGRDLRRWEFFLYSADGTLLERTTSLATGGQVPDSQSLWWRADSGQFGFSTYHSPVESGKTRKLHRYEVGRKEWKSWTVPGTSDTELSDVAWADGQTVYALAKVAPYTTDLLRLKLR